VLLCGGVGAGKSTIINSLLSVFNDEVVEEAVSASSTTSVTSKVRSYRLESTGSDVQTRIFLWDTPGFTYGDGARTYQHGQLTYILNGHIPHGFEGVDTVPITPDTPKLRLSPQPVDRMHVVLLCVHYKSLEPKNNPYMARVDEFVECITNKASPWTESECARNYLKPPNGLVQHWTWPSETTFLNHNIVIPALQPILLVTHVDELDPRINTDKSMLFKSHAVKLYLDMASQKTGLPRKCIFPVSTFTSASLFMQCFA
jgi:hypothetical protein